MIRTLQVTGWLAGNERPFRIGVYQRKGPGGILFSHWDGVQWCFTADSAARAFAFVGVPSHNQQLPWRGLAGAPTA